eukprot:6211752-Pleurochrysis_carterae.AAC.2
MSNKLTSKINNETGSRTGGPQTRSTAPCPLKRVHARVTNVIRSKRGMQRSSELAVESRR